MILSALHLRLPDAPVGLTATVCSTKADEAQSLMKIDVSEVRGLHDLHVIPNVAQVSQSWN
jgi:hypothetical protein